VLTGVHKHHMAHRLNIVISNQQYVFLNGEADRSSVSIAELVRRALDTVYGPRGERDLVEVMHTLGRRPGRRIP
jgi:hypothetical protein